MGNLPIPHIFYWLQTYARQLPFRAEKRRKSLCGESSGVIITNGSISSAFPITKKLVHVFFNRKSPSKYWSRKRKVSDTSLSLSFYWKFEKFKSAQLIVKVHDDMNRRPHTSNLEFTWTGISLYFASFYIHVCYNLK